MIKFLKTYNDLLGLPPGTVQYVGFREERVLDYVYDA
jgi:hypothetical protein